MMSKGEFMFGIGVGLFVNYFVVFTALTYHYLPYWGSVFLVNLTGLFCGFVLGAFASAKMGKKRS